MKIPRQRRLTRQSSADTAERIRGNDRRDFFVTIGVREPQGLTPGRQLRSRNHGGQSVEDVIFRFLHNRIRNRAAAGFAHVGAEAVHHRADRISCRPGMTREYSRRSEAQSASHQGTARHPLEAAIVNRALAQSDETDDNYSAGGAHPGCAVVPAALAEIFGIDGTHFLRAVTLGYDIGMRHEDDTGPHCPEGHS